MRDLATKADLMAVTQILRIEMQAMKNRLLRWMVGGFLTQTAVILAVLAIMK
jgi:hypothetical protein